MDPTFLIPISIVVGIILIAVVSGIYAHRQEKKRTEAFKKIADELSFEFLPSGRGALLGELEGFHLFSQGHSKSLFNLLQGTAGGLEISIFDYRYVTGSGKHRHTWTHSVFVATRAGMDLPMFSMRPENIWHKIGGLFGMQDIDFETHPKFSKSYLLKGPEEEAIRATFQHEVLEYFETRTGLNVEGAGDLLVYSTYTRLRPEKIRDFMAEGFEILKLFEPVTGN